MALGVLLREVVRWLLVEGVLWWVLELWWLVEVKFG